LLMFVVVYFLQVSPPNSYAHFFCPAYLPLSLPLTSFLIWSSEQYLLNGISHEVSHLAVFSSPLLCFVSLKYPVLEHPQPIFFP
jgi:hypothetical protein